MSQFSEKSWSTLKVSNIAFHFKGDRQNISHQTVIEGFNEVGGLSQIRLQDCLTYFILCK